MSQHGDDQVPPEGDIQINPSDAAELQRIRDRLALYEQTFGAVPANARQYMAPDVSLPDRAIAVPNMDFEIKTGFIAEIRRHQFGGKHNECPMAHLQSFKDLCDTIADGAHQ